MVDNGNSPNSGLIPGTKISHYEIVKKIGCGAMGEVYLAKDTNLDRLVALKFLADNYSGDTEARQRLIREAKAVSRLNHPNVMTVHSVEEFENQIFIVMEYIEGHTLKELIELGDLPIATAAQIAIQICDGLAEAHRAGIIHRDIKSQNIIVDNDNRARICDFGLARWSGAPELTKTGSTVGTVAYMSPEQVQNDIIDQRSDLFSLGIVLYELFTGQLPFTGEYEAAVVYAIVNKEPEPMKNHKPEIPDQIQATITRLLEKKPENRYQTAEEAGLELSATMGIMAQPTSGIRFNYRWLSIAALVIGISILLLFISKNYSRESATKSRKMLAVMPLQNLGRPEYDYFASGITEEIITNLAKINGLGVISRTSVYQYQNSQKTLRQIGAELGVDYALEGSIRWERVNDTNYVRISAQLIRIADDTHLWAETYQRAMDRIFLVQSDIAEQVTSALNVALVEPKKSELRTIPTNNLEAYDYYLKGNAFYNQGWDAYNISQAIIQYEKAIALDSNFAMAYTMLSRAHSSMYWEYHDRTDARLSLARQAVEKALALQPDLSYAHLALGMYFYSTMNYEKALQEFAIARKGHPNDSDIARAIAGAQRRQGQFAEAAANYSLALEFDPRSHITAFDVGLTYGLMRNYPEAIRYMDLAISLTPEWPISYIYKAWLYIFSNGDIIKAKEVLQEAENKTDLRQIDYYWWLNRIVEPDHQKALANIVLGSDTVSYYLYRAEMFRLDGNDPKIHTYSDSARILIERKLTDRPDEARFHSQLGLALAGLDSSQSAIYEGQKAVELMPASQEALNALFLNVNLAEIYTIVGQDSLAIKQLKYMLSIPGFVSVPYLKLDPIWNPLREKAAFKELISDAK
jgi:eukaryotic-like serine/threonine-protein kinase